MRLPETPTKMEDLGLLKRLKEYVDKKATWKVDNEAVGEKESQSCATLYTNIIDVIEKAIAPLLDKINAREMSTFTLHDRMHGYKVAHIMWYIISEERSEKLTPPEIALLIYSAFIHDIGMALSPHEREKRLDPSSDLWDQLEFDEDLKDRIEELKAKSEDKDLGETVRERNRQKLAIAEEAMLCADTRDRHSSKDRYKAILVMLQEFHIKEPEKIPDFKSCLSFDGDSFEDKLLMICESHNMDAVVLSEMDEIDINKPKFAKDYPVGCCEADLHMVAAALRIADILDFDRERTPPMLFHYLLPGTLTDIEDRAVVEWSKHLSISNWSIEENEIVFRGRCNNHIIHHAVVNFAEIIEREIISTRDTFVVRDAHTFPFKIPLNIKTNIEEIGYKYVPYKFELDDERVYKLLMGGAIYDNPLMAVRELIQNAVDACMYRDKITQLYETAVTPGKENRITITYEEPTDDFKFPKLIIEDSGSGMDKFILENYFLRVGRSFYDSIEFNRNRIELRKKNLDFAPISEFGIGFLSCFLLTDSLNIETAMWKGIRGDTDKMILQIDGPTRLIKLSVGLNKGMAPFNGTKITLLLNRGNPDDKESSPPSWAQIKEYLISICHSLYYPLRLRHNRKTKEIEEVIIRPKAFNVPVIDEIKDNSIKIPVKDEKAGIEGEIVLFNNFNLLRSEKEKAKKAQIDFSEGARVYQEEAILGIIRGGFLCGGIPGIPKSLRHDSSGCVNLKWSENKNKRLLLPNLSRNSIAHNEEIKYAIFKIWLSYLLDNEEHINKGFLHGLYVPLYEIVKIEKLQWLGNYNAYTLYKLVKKDWQCYPKLADALPKWEKGEGELFYDPTEPLLSTFLGNLILSRITRLKMRPEAKYYLAGPVKDWFEILSSCSDFISNNIKWPLFIEYAGGIEELLYYEYPGSYHLNLKFKDRLNSFDENESQRLVDLFEKLVDSIQKGRIAYLSQYELSLFNKAKDLIGDLVIGSYNITKRIDEYGPSQN
ncbi:MAG: HD domain-containing protein [Candidatus Hodarchaeales archaeon]|jgi:hypothetical protein